MIYHRILAGMLCLAGVAACSDPTAPGARRQHSLIDDLTPPTIVAVTVSPSSVDASASAVSITFHFDVTDDLAGIRTCALAFASPSGAQGISMTAWVPTNLVAGTPTNAVLEASNTLPRYSESGVWSMRWVECSDETGNSRYYDQWNPPPFPVPSFTVTSAGDTQPPVIAALSVSPSEVDVSSGAASVTFHFEVSDNLAGIRTCAVGFTSPSGAQHISMTAWVPQNLVAGTPTNAVLEASNTLPQYSEAGVWSLRWVECSDETGNSRYYDQWNPPPFTPGTLTVVSQQDITPPEIVTVSITPSLVDVSRSAATMTFHFEVMDDVAGIRYCAAAYTSPSGQQNISMTAWVPQNIVSGTPNDAVLQADNTLPRYSESGVWTMRWVECTDEAGNSRYYDQWNPPPFGQSAFTVAPHDPASLLDDLIARVRELEAAGELSHGEANGLIAKLQAARSQVERGNNATATNQLNAFLNQLDALRQSGRLSEASTADLRERAEVVQELLRAS